MAGYNELKGLRVKYLSADPANPEDGQVWYNSTTGNLRVQGIGVGAWSSGGLLNTGRLLGGAFGTQTAAVYSVGQNPVPLTSSNATEEYNGVGWSNGTNYPTSLGGTGGTAGTQTNGLFAGGPPGISVSNLYDGSTWTVTGSLNNGGDNIGNCGTGTTSDVIFCIGRTPATGNLGNNQSETFDGSIFTTAPNYNTSRMLGVAMGSGTATAGLIFGGFIDPSPGPTGLTACEEYNGTSWTTVNGLNRSDGLSSGWGTQTNTVKATGQPSYILAEQYDGSTWTNISDMSTGGPYANSAGSTGNAGMVTGLGPTRGQTEEYNFSSTTITPAAWSSGGALPTAVYNNAGGGTQTAALSTGGDSSATPPITTNTATNEYDGSAWTSGGALPAARTDLGYFGTQTANVVSGGTPSPAGSEQSTSFEYDGSTWTSGGTMNTAREFHGGSGTLTAGVICGGSDVPGTPKNNTEEYDGTTWTVGNVINTSRRGNRNFGTQTASVTVGGATPSYTTAVEEYDGTNWTSVNGIPQGTSWGGTSGILTAGLFFGGILGPGARTGVTSGYDGTNWSTRPSMADARNSLGSANATTSSADAGLGFGGYSPGTVTGTEEFTGETITVNPANNVDVS